MNIEKYIVTLEEQAGDQSEEFVNFFSSVWGLQKDVKAADWSPNIDLLNEKMKEGTVAFAIDAPALSQEEFNTALRPFIAYLVDFVSDPTPFKNLLEMIDKNTFVSDKEILQNAFTRVDELVEDAADAISLEKEENSGDYAALELAITSVLQPTAAAAAKQLTPPEQGSFNTGICPVCGSPAALGIIRDEGALNGSPRDLWCTLCNTTWKYPRIKCTRCGTTTQEDIGFYFDEQDFAHRIYGCKKCKQILKVANEKELKRTVEPRVEELLMGELEHAVVARSSEFLE